jgi:glycine/D-amino acid oxidase-like deaminating enzyme
MVFDTVIVGAGPAGLSAAAELPGNTLLLEQGPPAGERDRNDSRDGLSGVGGAGLFSDGKYSFFPSATALWKLPGVRDAFERTASFLAKYGIDAGPFPDRELSPASGPKVYPSIYVSLRDRFAMIDELQRNGRRGCIVAAGRAGSEILLQLENGEEVRTRNVLIATGRWSPRWIRPWLGALGAEYRPLRVELGIRLELPASAELFARLPGVDGKLRFLEEDFEIRTFCTCRDGEVIAGEAHGLRAFSGRADGPPTGRSNVGLVVRAADLPIEVGAPASFPLAEWPVRGRELFSALAFERISVAIERLRRFAPLDGAQLHAPVIEGVGDYPADDGALGVAPGVFVAGDACGRFRGIVAAMISGRYAATRIARR